MSYTKTTDDEEILFILNKMKKTIELNIPTPFVPSYNLWTREKVDKIECISSKGFLIIPKRNDYKMVLKQRGYRIRPFSQ